VLDDLSFDILEALKNVDDTKDKRKRGRSSKNKYMDDSSHFNTSSKKIKIIHPAHVLARAPTQAMSGPASKVLSSLPRSTKILFVPAPGGQEVAPQVPRSTKMLFVPAAGGQEVAPQVVRRGVVALPAQPSRSLWAQPGVRKLLCSLCKGVFHTRSEFDAHVKNEHRQRAAAEKQDVKQTVKEPEQRTVALQQSWDCDQCSDKHASSKALQGHKKLAHNFKCKLTKCKLVLASKEQLDSHVKAEHMFKCNKCASIFDQKGLLEKHVKSAHHFRCPGCPEVLESAQALAEHTEARHSGCEVCEDEFSWAEAGHSCYYTKLGIRPQLG
jgi:uncharacterized C2H2 Zn-finger protein